MLALPHPSKDISWSLLQISLGFKSLFSKDTGTSGPEDFSIREQVMSEVRGLLTLARDEFRNSSKIVERSTAIILALDAHSLLASEYKSLRIMKDVLTQQLAIYAQSSDDLTEFDHPVAEAISEYITARQQQRDALDKLFSQNEITDENIAGFRVISQDEAWSTRTRAYDYLT